ncbi:hypothetical protein NIES37_62620 [Tolypothrix tenuis PCC 7101]|uniref:Uncharacterized protein n=1 Tax=Tolypothrix tenuis PCC 7101 TaxID=231146 RepID=A0A1Z4N979_9CYAN|nr:hypothetical protein [Aulosira sp. FACHB-113]BAZ02250.1 hypothetical protein NIES37_62620 [Tolypothrix tenuis PCC 7101]BAZ73829.1 hypothetical protein NIES50_23950 [Aulosira laxa NIES-50]
MSYCNIGDSPKVYFKFNGQSKQIYSSKESPIDVSMTDYSTYGANFSSTGYRINVYSTNNFQYVNLTVRNYQIVDNGAGSDPIFRYTLYVQYCNSDVLEAVFAVNPSTLTTHNDASCPTTKPDIRKSKLEIKKAGTSTIIFTTEGDYPGSFEVACADCPAGTCRCESDSYPGYCCQDCASLASQVRQIKNTVQIVNSKGKVKYG